MHFFPDDPADAIARKALRVNLSDLAAKGAKPAGFLLSLALPKGIGDAWLKSFARGLGGDARRYDCPLLGGDTVRTPGPLMVSVAAFGTLPSGTMVRRDGARVGDHVLVTGTIGDAALGLKLRHDRKAARRWKLSAAQRGHLARRYLVPQPRNALAFAVRKYATAAMDVSDGLAGDLGKLCRASGVAAVIDVARVPLSAAARTALTGGAQAARQRSCPAATTTKSSARCGRPGSPPSRRRRARVGVPVTDIGRIVRGPARASSSRTARRYPSRAPHSAIFDVAAAGL